MEPTPTADPWTDLVARLLDAAAGRGADPATTELAAALTDRHATGRFVVPEGAARVVGEVYGLDDVDLFLLLVAAAPDLDADVARLVGALRGSDRPARTSWALALELAGIDPLSPSSARRLGVTGWLVRSGLVAVVGPGPRPLRDLVVPERVVDHLLGVDVAPPNLVALLLPGVGLTGLPGEQVVARALESGERLVWITSGAGGGGLPLAVAALDTMDVGSLVVDLGQVREEDLAEVVRAAVREAALRRAVLVLVGADLLQQVPAAVDAVHGGPVPVVGIGAVAWSDLASGPRPVSVTAPVLTDAHRAELWGRSGGPARGDAAAADGTGLAGLRLQPAVIPRIADYAGRLSTALDAVVDDALLRRAARDVTSPAGLARSRRPIPPSFDDLVLPTHLDGQLRRLVQWARVRGDLLAEGRLVAPGGKGSGLAALFAGNPGTGKTMAAEVVANELGVDLMTVDLSKVVDKYIGETEKNLERIFAHAESLDVVLFFDEADALFGKRTEVKDSHDRHANQEVAYLLQRIEVFDGVTLLATNLRGNLDPAFSRRMAFVLTFPDPDAPTRRRLWQRQLLAVSPLDPADPVDLEALSGHELAGGAVHNIVVAAGYEAAVEGGPVGARHLDRAIDWEYLKLGRRRS